MLDARAEVVEFTGRDAELSALRAWRDSAPPVAAQWLYGEGGQGKTRLAGQLARESERAGWKVVDAVHGTDTHPPAPDSQDLRLGEKTAGVLLLVDYADRWPVTDLGWLFQNSLLTQPEPAKVRVLMIGRSRGSLQALRGTIDKLRRNIDTSVTLLTPLPGGGEARDRMFDSARDCFARYYPEVAEPAAITPPRSLGHADFGLILAVHMAALVAVDAAVRGRTPPADMVGLSAYLLDREYENWRQLYENAGRGLDYRTPDTVMARAVFTAILTGPTARPRAGRILGGLIPRTPADPVLTDHAVCYPPADPATALEPMIPDRLAEDFLALLVPGHPVLDFPSDTWATGVADALLTAEDTRGHAPRALTFLASATDRWPHVGTNVLYPLLSEDPGVAVDGGSAALTAIATIGAAENELDPALQAVLETVEPLLPKGSHADLDVGILSVVERLTERYLADTTDPAQRAWLYSGLGSRRSNAAEWAAALTADAEAAGLYRQLAADDGRYRENLGISLNNLANALASLGRGREAVAQAREAVATHRAVPEPSPRERGSLALSLVGLGTKLTQADRPDEAAPVIAEAVRIRRELAEADPGRYGHDLAIALTNLATPLRALGREAEASAAAEEAVEWGRRLATADPARSLDFLATSLHNLARMLLGQGDRERAVATQVEAVDAFRRMAAVNPRAHKPGLVLALTNLSLILVELDRGQEALVPGEEAVLLARELAEGGAIVDRRQLAGSLTALGDIMGRLGRSEDELACYQEAIEALEEISRVNRVTESEEARLRYRLAGMYAKAGDRENEAVMLLNFSAAAWSQAPRPEVIDAARRAALLFRELDDRASEGAALSNLSALLANNGADEEAITACERAAEIYREKGDRTLESGVLTVLSNALISAKRYDEAISASQRAIAIDRELSKAPNGELKAGSRCSTSARHCSRSAGRLAIPALEQAAALYQRTGRGEYRTAAAVVRGRQPPPPRQGVLDGGQAGPPPVPTSGPPSCSKPTATSDSTGRRCCRQSRSSSSRGGPRMPSPSASGRCRPAGARATAGSKPWCARTSAPPC